MTAEEIKIGTSVLYKGELHTVESEPAENYPMGICVALHREGDARLIMAPIGDLSMDPLEGVCWPWMPNGDDTLPWVERDDESDRFDTDEEAAQHVAKLIGSRVMWSSINDPWEDDEDYEPDVCLRPFVIPRLDVGIGTPTFDRWLAEREIVMDNLKRKGASL